MFESLPESDLSLLFLFHYLNRSFAKRYWLFPKHTVVLLLCFLFSLHCFCLSCLVSLPFFFYLCLSALSSSLFDLFWNSDYSNPHGNTLCLCFPVTPISTTHFVLACILLIIAWDYSVFLTDCCSFSPEGKLMQYCSVLSTLPSVRFHMPLELYFWSSSVIMSGFFSVLIFFGFFCCIYVWASLLSSYLFWVMER